MTSEVINAQQNAMKSNVLVVELKDTRLLSLYKPLRKRPYIKFVKEKV